MEDNDFSKIGTAVLETYFRPLSVMATRMPMQSATGGFTAAACAIRKREVNNIDFIVKEEVRETCLVELARKNVKTKKHIICFT